MTLPAGKPRALLAVLLVDRNRVVSTDRLIDELWGDEPTETAAKALQGYVSQLRKAIGPDRLLTRPRGYELRVDEGELDLDRFERLVREGRELLGADSKGAAKRLGEALELWRGPALAEFSEPFARDAGARLEEERLAALEERIDADLALGRHDRLVPELEELVAREPLRERPRAQLMLALYRAGRQADALDLYRRTRETLSEELGIEPSRELQELERRILQQDPELDRARPAPRAADDFVPLRRRPQLLVLAALGLAAVAAAIAAIALTAGGSSGHSGKGELRSFVDKLENFLGQSQEGRRTVSAAVGGAVRCSLSPKTALARLDTVQRNRQSLLQQAAALAVPDTEQALRASDLLQQSIHASFSADGHYADWLAGRKRCGPPESSPAFNAARAADARATTTKRQFVATFNPLARRFHKPTWGAEQF